MKGLLFLIFVLVACYLIALLVKLWLLSRRKTRLQRSFMLKGQRQPLPFRRARGKNKRKE